MMAQGQLQATGIARYETGPPGIQPGSLEVLPEGPGVVAWQKKMGITTRPLDFKRSIAFTWPVIRKMQEDVKSLLKFSGVARSSTNT